MSGWGLLPTARQHPNEMVVKRISVGGDGTRTANGWRSQGPNDPPPSGLPPASRGEGEGEEGRAGSRRHRQYSCTVQYLLSRTRAGVAAAGHLTPYSTHPPTVQVYTELYRAPCSG